MYILLMCKRNSIIIGTVHLDLHMSSALRTCSVYKLNEILIARTPISFEILSSHPSWNRNHWHMLPQGRSSQCTRLLPLTEGDVVMTDGRRRELPGTRHVSSATKIFIVDVETSTLTLNPI